MGFNIFDPAGIVSDLGGMFGGGGGSSPSAPPASPTPTDYSAAMIYASDNNKIVALAQIEAQEFAIQQASLDRQMQLAANLELGIEKLDTKLEVAKLDFFQQMTAEQNRHVEKLAELGKGQPGAMELPSTDLPEPTSEVA